MQYLTVSYRISGNGSFSTGRASPVNSTCLVPDSEGQCGSDISAELCEWHDDATHSVWAWSQKTWNRNVSLSCNSFFLHFLVHIPLPCNPLPPSLYQLEEKLYSGDIIDMEKQQGLSESQRKLVSAILDCIDTGDHTENRQSGHSARLNAAHLFFSALEGEGELQPEGGCQPFPQCFSSVLSNLVFCFCFCRVAWWNSEPPEWEKSWFSRSLRHTG